MPHAGEEFGAPGRAECLGAGLRGEVGEVILSAVENLEGVAQARHLFKEASGLGREVPWAYLFRWWRLPLLPFRRGHVRNSMTWGYTTFDLENPG